MGYYPYLPHTRTVDQRSTICRPNSVFVWYRYHTLFIVWDSTHTYRTHAPPTNARQSVDPSGSLYGTGTIHYPWYGILPILTVHTPSTNAPQPVDPSGPLYGTATIQTIVWDTTHIYRTHAPSSNAPPSVRPKRVFVWYRYHTPSIVWDTTHIYHVHAPSINAPQSIDPSGPCMVPVPYKLFTGHFHLGISATKSRRRGYRTQHIPFTTTFSQPSPTYIVPGSERLHRCSC